MMGGIGRALSRDLSSKAIRWAAGIVRVVGVARKRLAFCSTKKFAVGIVPDLSCRTKEEKKHY